MNLLVIAPAVSVVCTGLLAGIFFGFRAGPQVALHSLSPSSFVQFQQIVHRYFVRFMPPLNILALLATVTWAIVARARHAFPEFWLAAVAAGGVFLLVAMTRAVNVPLNSRLMTFDVAAPPDNLREIWMPWERINTLRACVATLVLILEAIALSLRVVSGQP
jgi:uncharacterized membrane protein